MNTIQVVLALRCLLVSGEIFGQSEKIKHKALHPDSAKERRAVSIIT